MAATIVAPNKPQTIATPGTTIATAIITTRTTALARKAKAKGKGKKGEVGEKKVEEGEYTSGPNQVMATDKLMTWDVTSAVTVRMADSPPANTPPFSVPTLMMKVAGQAAKLPALKVRIEEFEVQ